MSNLLSSVQARFRNLDRRHVFVFVGLLFFTLLIRAPYFGANIIRDEATFVLMGQSLLDGNLPYTHLWDNKPPLIFAFMTAVIVVAGKSAVAIRFAGALCVFGAAWWTYQSGARLWSRAAGLLAACFVILYVSISSHGQEVMSEIVALPGLMWALSRLLRSSLRTRDSFMAGVGIAIASLVRLNLAYVAVAVGLLLALRAVSERGWNKALQPVFVYAAGGLLPLLVIAAPYIFSAQLSILIESVFLAPLAYATSRHSALSAVSSIVRSGVRPEHVPLLIGSVGALGLWGRSRRAQSSSLPSDERWNLALLTTFGVATAWSIIKSGGGFGHYFIQLVPFLALPAGRLCETLVAGRPLVIRIAGWAVLLGALFFSGKEIPKQYERVNDSPRGLKIAQYIQKHNPDGRPVYCMTDHIVHWYLGTEPIAKIVTHPTNITKGDLLPFVAEKGATARSELERIFEKEPMFIVIGKDNKVDNRPKVGPLLKKNLAKHYRLVKKFSTTRIYVLKKYDWKRR